MEEKKDEGKKIKILAIETSCDETGVSILEFDSKDNFTILSDVLLSQVEKHAEYGGVYPTLAKREHAKNLVPLTITALSEAELLRRSRSDRHCEAKPKQSRIISILSQLLSGSLRGAYAELDSVLAMTPDNKIEKMMEREPELYKMLSTSLLSKFEKPDIDAIAVTHGPGLAPALWIGVNFARALSMAWDIPLVPTNHLEGHILSATLEEVQPSALQKVTDIAYPAIALIVSGGHTELILMKQFMHYERIGGTRDDALGEAYDKVARLLELGYPGGPIISQYAQMARDEALEQPFSLPRPLINSDDFDFSFAGLKTAVLRLTQKLRGPEPTLELCDIEKKQIAREFEDAALDTILAKTQKAIENYRGQSLIIGGGVSANNSLRERVQELTKEMNGLKVYVPKRSLSGDNALMIALAGYFRFKKGETRDPKDVSANGNLRLY